MRSHVLLLAAVLGSGLAMSSAFADVVIDLPPPVTRAVTSPEPAVATAAAPTAAPDAGARASVDVGTVAIARYGRMRSAPRDTYGPRRGSGYGSYGYGSPYGYGYYYPYRYYPFVTRYHFGLAVHLHHGQARVIGYPYW